MRQRFAFRAALCGFLAVTALFSPAAEAYGPKTLALQVPSGWRMIGPEEFAALSNQPEMHASALERQVTLRSARNSLWVAAERNHSTYPGMLRARSETAGGWESFSLVWNDELRSFTIRAEVNGMYVTVERNLTGANQHMLRARSATAGSWEEFTLYHNEANGRYALQSDLNGLFVAMENEYTGSSQYMLRARSESIGGSWEEFELADL